ncbi:MAG: ABC transporter permease subunit [Clostridia bacterium]|nr:ABC transporter permease subunit [Clostridia bacterium]
MKSVFTIIKHEFARFFKDTRLWITVLLLPGLLIFALYSLMGTIMENVVKGEEGETSTAYVVHMPESLSATLGGVFDLKVNYTSETALEAVKEGKLDLYINFPENFDAEVDAYSPALGTPAPNVEIYYNSGETKSLLAYNVVTSMLSAYEEALANKFDINRPAADGENNFDLTEDQSGVRTILSTVVPMLLLMLLFSGCMSVAPEAIAGEKERGTIATLLVTPVKRSSVAIGKIIALSVIALLCGLSSAIGLLFSLPKLMGSVGVGLSALSIFSFGDIVAVLAVILSSVLIFVTLISIISAYAKSVKEASGLVVPLMIVLMLCGVFSMFAGGFASIGLYFIPVFNSALVISSVMAGAVSAAGVAITVCINLAVAALLVIALTFMFKSERIMFNR